MTMHFISGLPRSGSTLLSAVLRQNPRFKADISSGLHGVLNAALPLLSLDELVSTTDNALRRRVLLGLFDSFYPEHHAHVVFDTQRPTDVDQPFALAG